MISISDLKIGNFFIIDAKREPDVAIFMVTSEIIPYSNEYNDFSYFVKIKEVAAHGPLYSGEMWIFNSFEYYMTESRLIDPADIPLYIIKHNFAYFDPKINDSL